MAGFLDLDELLKGRHFDREVVVLCVRWYLRFKLSYRDPVEMMAGHAFRWSTPRSCAGCVAMLRSSSGAGTSSLGRPELRGGSMRCTERHRTYGCSIGLSSGIRRSVHWNI